MRECFCQALGDDNVARGPSVVTWKQHASQNIAVAHSQREPQQLWEWIASEYVFLVDPIVGRIELTQFLVSNFPAELCDDVLDVSDDRR